MHSLPLFLMLLACTTQLFCGSTASSSQDPSPNRYLIDSDEEKGTWLIDINQELTRLEATPRLQDTVTYHLGGNSDWAIHDYEEIFLTGGRTCGPQAGYCNFGIAIVYQPIDTSTPGWRTMPSSRRKAVSSKAFKETVKQSHFEIERDLQLNFGSKSTYKQVSAHQRLIYPYLFLCSDRDEEVNVQGLLKKHAQTVNSVAAAMQLIYPNVDPRSTYILFDVDGYCNYDQKLEKERQEWAETRKNLWSDFSSNLARSMKR